MILSIGIGILNQRGRTRFLSIVILLRKKERNQQ